MSRPMPSLIEARLHLRYRLAARQHRMEITYVDRCQEVVLDELDRLEGLLLLPVQVSLVDVDQSWRSRLARWLGRNRNGELAN